MKLSVQISIVLKRHRRLKLRDSYSAYCNVLGKSNWHPCKCNLSSGKAPVPPVFPKCPMRPSKPRLPWQSTWAVSGKDKAHYKNVRTVQTSAARKTVVDRSPCYSVLLIENRWENTMNEKMPTDACCCCSTELEYKWYQRNVRKTVVLESMLTSSQSESKYLLSEATTYRDIEAIAHNGFLSCRNSWRWHTSIARIARIYSWEGITRIWHLRRHHIQVKGRCIKGWHLEEIRVDVNPRAQERETRTEIRGTWGWRRGTRRFGGRYCRWWSSS